MTTKTIKYLSLLAVLAVSIGAGTFAITTNTVDADDINKGIGTTEVWEPGPVDGGAVYIPDKLFDANKNSEYASMEKTSIRFDVTKEQLLEEFELIKNAKIGITSLAIDYDRNMLVIYSPDTTLDKKIVSVIGDTPYVLIYEEEHPLRGPNSDGPVLNSQIGKQTIDDPLLAILSETGILNFAYAVSDSAYGSKINNDVDYDGAYARLEIHDSGVTIPSGDTVFGGNIMPSSYSSLEVAIEYKPTTTKVRVYDHYAGSFTTSKTVDSTFMGTYSASVGGNDYIYVKVEENSGTWKAYIYNFDISSYEFLDSQTQDGSRSDGWAVWEEYSLTGDCGSATIPEIKGTLVQLRDSGTWNFVTSSFGSTYDVGTMPCYSGSMNSNYYDWDVS